jgi:hypothetical protein
LVFLLASCRPPSLSLSPVPSKISTIEGHASLKLITDLESTRSKFAFFFQRPHRGKIEVSGALGKVLYRILIDEGSAFFIVPSKKVYWKGEEEEILEKFLGFRLNLEEMISLMSGKWDDGPNWVKETGVWSLKRDRKGRIVAGQRGELWFEITEFIEDTPFASRLVFGHTVSSGQMKVLSIGLNRPPRENIFSRRFLEKYAQKSWAEIQELFDHAR